MNHIRPVIVAAMLAVLTGCSGSGQNGAFAPTQSSLYITSEGAVTNAVVETYDKDYYSADELRASVDEILRAFNAESGDDAADENGESAASIQECVMADGIAKLLIEFPDADMYLKFMEQYPDEESEIQVTNLDITTIPDGITKGYLVGKNFKQTSNSKEVSADDVMKQSRLYVAAVEGAALVQTDGAVQYISDGVSMEGTNLVRTPADEVSFIVFR